MWLNSHDQKWLIFKRPLTIVKKEQTDYIIIEYGIITIQQIDNITLKFFLNDL